MNSNNAYLERLALVVSVNEDCGTAVCEYGVNGLCGACTEKSDDCVTDIFASGQKTMAFTLKNTCDARVNQVVRVGVPAKSLLLSSFISYVSPLVFMLTGAGLTFWLMSGHENADIYAAVGAFIGLVFGFVTAAITAKIMQNTIWNPRMLGVLPFSPKCNTQQK